MINPCPNPKCYGHRKHVPGWFIPPMLSNRCGKAIVVCGCGLTGPERKDESAAIAAWNSISMGWINAKDKEPPKDGTWFLAPLRFEKEWRWVPSRYVSASGTIEYVAYAERAQNPEYLYGDRMPKFWMPIPPAPEGK